MAALHFGTESYWRDDKLLFVGPVGYEADNGDIRYTPIGDGRIRKEVFEAPDWYLVEIISPWEDILRFASGIDDETGEEFRKAAETQQVEVQFYTPSDIDDSGCSKTSGVSRSDVDYKTLQTDRTTTSTYDRDGDFIIERFKTTTIRVIQITVLVRIMYVRDDGSYSEGKFYYYHNQQFSDVSVSESRRYDPIFTSSGSSSGGTNGYSSGSGGWGPPGTTATPTTGKSDGGKGTTGSGNSYNGGRANSGGKAGGSTPSSTTNGYATATWTSSGWSNR